MKLERQNNRTTVINKTCPFCGHDRAFSKNIGIECTKCRSMNKGTKIVKNKHGKLIVKAVL